MIYNLWFTILAPFDDDIIDEDAEFAQYQIFFIYFICLLIRDGIIIINFIIINFIVIIINFIII